MRYLQFGLTILLLSGAKCSFGQTASLSYDTSRIAIIRFEKFMTWIYDNRYVSANLTQADIIEIDDMYNKSIVDFNSKHSGNGMAYTIDPKKRNYKRQYVCVINKKGQKEVFVNCFCDSYNHDWKNEVIEVKDGGSCYFNFKVNLATRKYSDFSVNGEA